MRACLIYPRASSSPLSRLQSTTVYVYTLQGVRTDHGLHLLSTKGLTDRLLARAVAHLAPWQEHYYSHMVIWAGRPPWSMECGDAS